jgi:hypothetical protein
MSEETFVLGGEHRIDHVPRHFCESEFTAETLCDARFAQRNSISIEQSNALDRRTEKRGRDGHEAKSEMQGDQQRSQGGEG